MQSCLRVGQKLSNEINFLSPKVNDKDRDSFGFDDENIILEDGWIMAHVMHRAGVFPSVSQARKNGWDKPIPKGMSEFVVGKRKFRVWILNLEGPTT